MITKPQGGIHIEVGTKAIEEIDQSNLDGILIGKHNFIGNFFLVCFFHSLIGD